MKRYVCSICGYVYDEAIGDPNNGIVAGTKWDDLPLDWNCPLCGAMKSDFVGEATKDEPVAPVFIATENDHAKMRGYSYGELSALFSNLSKGCQKQYRDEEAGLFDQLAEFYKTQVSSPVKGRLKDIDELIQNDLEIGYQHANAMASGASDRGSLRSLVWGEKVTKILSSLLSRFEKQQDTLLEDTNAYVCEICGFVYIGDVLPDICPVCKVPNKKFIQIKRGGK